jgi:hypothetical protein
MQIRQFAKIERKSSLLDKLKNADKFAGDEDIYTFVVGTEDKPIKNVVRPVGELEIIRMHYIAKFISETSDIPRGVVCAGQGRCPICSVGTELWHVGTEESKERAKELFAKERCYWNIIPRGIIKGKELEEFDWGESEPRCLIMPFGKLMRQQLQEIQDMYGDPSDIKEGYDLVISVYKQSEYGNKYTLEPMKTKVKTTKGWSDEIEFNKLSSEELNYELVDLSKYTAMPSNEMLSKIAELFDVESPKPAKKKKKVREELSSTEDEEETEEVDEEEEEADDEEFLCFGNPKVYDVKKTSCKNCSKKLKCKVVVLKDINKRETRKAKKNVPF